MLIEFTVENWRNFDREVCLDLRAVEDSDSVKVHHTVQIDGAQTNEKHTHVLPIAGLFGANNAGKTNLIEAFKFLQAAVIDGMLYVDEDAYDKNRPVTFSITIKHNGRIIQYGLSILCEHITDEWLCDDLPSGEWDTVFEFSQDVFGEVMTHPYLWDVVDESTIAHYAYDWIAHCAHVMDFDGYGHTPSDTLRSLEKSGVNLCNVTQWLAQNDRTIQKIEHVPRDEATLIDYLVYHKDKDRKWAVDVAYESLGTLRLLDLYAVYADALKHEDTLFIDNFCEGIHPNLARVLCLYFTREDTNPNGAQLIFTSHDVQLLAPNTLFDDEIYFVDTVSNLGDNNGLYSLCEFKKIGGGNIRNYLTGRYDAIPVFPNGNGLFVPQMGNN